MHRLALGTRAAGYKVVICCFIPGPVVERFERDGIAVEVLNLYRPSVLNLPGFVIYLWRAFTGLRRVIRQHGVTVIHAHLSDSIIWAALIGRLDRLPVVGTYAGMGIMPKNRWTLDPRNLARRMAYRWAERRCGRTIAVSGAVRNLLCGEYGFRQETTLTIPNGIDPALVTSRADDDSLRTTLGLEGCRVVSCMARLIPGKGQRHLIEAMASIASLRPDVHLLLVGDGPDRAALAKLIQHHGVADRVHLLGFRTDVPALLGLTEVVVLPTFSEGFPMSVLEAMAAAKPVVVTAIAGNFEVVGDDRCGKFVPAGDAAALAEAIITLLDQPDVARQMGLRGQARVRQHFDLREIVSRTVAVYEALYGEVGELHFRTA